MFRDTALDNYRINQTEVPILPSKESKEIFHFVYCQIIRGVSILTENFKLLSLLLPATNPGHGTKKVEAPFSSSALLVTHSGVDSTFRVSGRNTKLLVYLEVRDRIVD